jgi:molybdopterin converting factor small subunit
VGFAKNRSAEEAVVISVSIRYFNILAGYSGKKQETLRLPEGTTGRQLILHLVAIYGEPFRGVVLSGEGLSDHLRIFRNEQSLHGEALDAPLEDEDHIMLFPAVAGG